MTADDRPYDRTLREGWDEFCDGLKRAGDLIFRSEAPATELDRTAGIRYISQYVAKTLNDWVEFADPLFPQLWVLQKPTNKSFGDNPDCTYTVGKIDGSLTYRVVGNRGTAKWIWFVLRYYDEEAGSYLTHDQPSIANHELQTEWDGSFVVTLSPDPHPGNWMKTVPGQHRLMIREFFGDWDRETPMRARIERVGAEGEVPTPMTAEQLTAGLRMANRFIVSESNRWLNYIEYFRARPNEFADQAPPWTVPAEGTTGRFLKFCFFDLEPNEGLLIEFTPPRCLMWIFEQDNYWMNSMDYRYHFSSINSSQAQVNDDGTVTIVVSSSDPGTANWLDPAGHRQGLLICRWVFDGPPDDGQNPLPDARVVKLAELGDETRNAKRVDRAERLLQLRKLKVGTDRRFGTY